MGTDRITECLV